MRRRAKVDDNQRDIVATLRAHGATVVSLAEVGSGCPDLLIGLDGVTLLAEVKDGSKRPSQSKLTQQQRDFIEIWQGAAVAILRSVEQADQWARVIKGRRR